MSQSIGNASLPIGNASLLVVDAVDSATPSPTVPGLVSSGPSGSSTPLSKTVPTVPFNSPASPAAPAAPASPAAPAASAPGPVRTARRRSRTDPSAVPHVPGQWGVYGWTEAGRRGEGLVPGTSALSQWRSARAVVQMREAMRGPEPLTHARIAELQREAAVALPMLGFLGTAAEEMEADEERFNAEQRTLAAGRAAEPVWDPRNNIPGYHAEDSSFWSGGTGYTLGDPFEAEE